MRLNNSTVENMNLESFRLGVVYNTSPALVTADLNVTCHGKVMKSFMYELLVFSITMCTVTYVPRFEMKVSSPCHLTKNQCSQVETICLLLELGQDRVRKICTIFDHPRKEHVGTRTGILCLPRPAKKTRERGAF